MALAVQPVSPLDGSLLDAVRETLSSAETALLCVAFVADAGVHLVERELEGLGGRGRLLATTVFGSTAPSALSRVRKLGGEVRTLNPAGSSTFHPKLYLGRRGDEISAVVGSANLTRGLVCNVEVACHLHGPAGEPSLDRLWTWAEEQWGSAQSTVWEEETGGESGGELLDPELELLLRTEVQRNPVFHTLGPKPAENLVREIGPGGLYVETEASQAKGRPPQEVPAWMLNLAWGYLRTHGKLSNSYLLNELRVHRSSAVCAFLARLPGVERAPGRKIALVWFGLEYGTG